MARPFAAFHAAALRAMELTTGQDPDEGVEAENFVLFSNMPGAIDPAPAPSPKPSLWQRFKAWFIAPGIAD